MFKGLSLLAATEVGASVSRNLRALPYFLVGGLILLIGFGFLLALAHGWLAQELGSMAASGVIAATLISCAGLLLIIGSSIKARRVATSSPLTTTALIAAPMAASFMAGVIAAGALLGRYLGRSDAS
jgi:nitrate reductase gamma subunit